MSSEAQTVEITVNGERRAVPAGLTIASLLNHLDVPRERVAIELNRRIVRKPSWETTQISGGDEMEIVQFVGGGI